MGLESKVETPDDKPTSLFVQSQPGIEHSWFLFPSRASGLAKTLISFRNLSPSWPGPSSPGTFQNVLLLHPKTILHVRRHRD